MGYLFENIEKMDIQAERRNPAQARAEAEAAKEEAERKLISLVERKIAKGQTDERIAEDLLEPVEYIRELRERIR
ncbi:MAG: hypothetical protein LUG27_07050 [Clostridiales bacterium]|nr:hypothetical protein [Clostridiales bacterium]